MDNQSLYQTRKKLRRIKEYIAFFSCILFMIGGPFLIYEELDFRMNSEITTAEIVGYTKYEVPILSYTVDGTNYNATSKNEITNSQIGMKIPIKYHKNNVTYVQTSENPLFKTSIIMTIFGFVGAIGFGLSLFSKWKLFKWL
ncbi:MAG: hypothetical protein AB6733_08020 [Clostridiaceae bacterium]